ncbi:phosphate ABC transporter substrate-binding protein PstS [Caldimonas tepidiphila]|uniref:phosphate ABC transporter substrate-binding protein PstS n=1 Tax=Caldimonas tepidiphila TaxID=2315841 RepID=UPI000E5B93C7|nr:phosphate ABC transporter substrate-binding protein PstS [Caldimonas tepidiphila]
MNPFRAARMLRAAVFCVAAALLAVPATAQVQGAGATFPSKVYERWAQAFAKSDRGTKVSYRPTNSGDGIRQISARTVQFGGTDTPLPPEELAQRRLVQLPMLVGGIVPVVNLPGIGDQRLRLDGPVLADIMSGRIARWNEAPIAALNPGVALPALPIRRIVRADKSGTTEGFTRYLAQVSASFRQQVGAAQAPSWPGEVVAAEGNDGMVRALKAHSGSIAYVSYDRSVQDRLSTVRLRNAAGHFVAASETGFRSAILESDLYRRNDDRASLLDRPGGETWPITLVSFVLVDALPASADGADAALRFLYWCFMNGDRLTQGTGFAPLPTSMQSQLATRFDGIRTREGQPLNYQVF